ncbi:MAG: hypothetical protein GKR94_29920 [Gammaproteobacteria bacterium]|nr:hypothetical protein [Gammaproteobacteria bacterium]
MKNIITGVWIVCIFPLMVGCAFDVIRVEQVPTSLSSAQNCDDSFILTKKIDIQLDSGYSRILKKGTKWNCIGSIIQGDVYKTKDQILTVEASNIYEANIVVSSGELVGFYLPVEGTFSPLDKRIQLVTN